MDAAVDVVLRWIYVDCLIHPHGDYFEIVIDSKILSSDILSVTYFCEIRQTDAVGGNFDSRLESHENYSSNISKNKRSV
jgi:hypothetical protein